MRTPNSWRPGSWHRSCWPLLVTAPKARGSEVLPLLLPPRPLSPYMLYISQPGTSPVAHQIPQAFAQKAEHSRRQKDAHLWSPRTECLQAGVQPTHGLWSILSLLLTFNILLQPHILRKHFFSLISLRKLKLSGKVLKFSPTLPVIKFRMPMSISPPERCLTCSLLLQLAASPPPPHHAQHTPSAHGSSSGKTHPRPS